MKVVLTLPVFAALAALASSERAWTYNGQSFKGHLAESNDVTGLCGNTTSKAGYFKIEGSKNKNYFYWSFAAQNNPETAPVLLWMTGGPGCSSELALLFENGPCHVNSEGTATVPNPFGWNQDANLVFIDQPAGVGFSYGDVEDEDFNEDMVAEDMFHFLHEYFAADSSLTNRPLYVFGESYGGHYAPATAFRIGKTLNLQGLAVGNGLTDPLIQYEYYPEMGYTYAKQRLGKPVITTGQYDTMKALWPACQKKIQQCQSDTSACPGAQSFCNEVMVAPYESHGLNPYDIRKPCGPNPLCYDFSNVDKFLADPRVLSTLGVDNIKWQSCNYTVNAEFSADWMKDYQTKVSGLLANNTRVLIYAGDVDYICNWIGNKQWTLALDWAGKDAFNSASDNAWGSVNGTAAGLLRQADAFSFLQIHNAGHMVPHDQPEIALTMVKEFLSNKLQ